MMDRPDADPGMVRDDLKNLRTINKLFGGFSAVRRNILPLMNSDGALISVVNVDKHRANAAIVTPPRLAQLAKADFQSFLNKTFFSNGRAGKRLDNLQSLGGTAAASPISLMVSPSSHRSAFLIGDAHRTVEPFTGERVFLALEDGLSAALCLLNARYSPVHVRSRPAHGRHWANRIYSHVLRNRWLADRLAAFGEQIPILMPLVARPILSKRVVS
jgi:2-polyprenyl-6-methoxyphenol hydroxylase-like FAD-dependent oxidoreductase